MITLADTLPPLALLAAVAALGLQARAIAALRASIEELKEAKRPAPPPRTGRPSAPTFGGLYAARPSPVSRLGEIPGGAPLAAAGLLGFAGLVLGLLGSGAATTPAADGAPVAGLRQTVDSLTSEVRTIQDSLRLLRSAPATVTAARPAPVRRETQRAAIVPPPPAILPAPVLSPIGGVTP
ncbi:MAG: hypothetical protein SF070_14270 [Gemmatimonadota bacterium]|nr:hypothetical protein [Gemmatimonadota bacterium]